MIAIYCQSASPRLHFILDELFRFRMGIDYRLIHTQSELTTAEGSHVPVVYYGMGCENAECITIPSSGLLFETGVHEYQLPAAPHEYWYYTLGEISANYTSPFDLFSAAFFLLSRYEEYTMQERDRHGRFMASSSLAHKAGFLQLPLVDLWCDALKKQLQRLYPSITFATNQYEQLITVDVDFAYYYRGIGLLKWLSRFIQSAIKLNVSALMQQLQAMVHEDADPYFTYPLFHAAQAEVAYFFLMSNAGGYDKNIRPDGVVMKHLIQKLQQQATFIGLHPSYLSNQQTELLHEEKDLLTSCLKQPVVHSRQHFLKLTLPQTFQELIKSGLKNDYSLMYAEVPGFRSSTCMPYRFYDISAEKSTQLILHTTCFMDTTAYQYTNQSDEFTIQQVLGMKTYIKKLGGCFVTLWHNNNFVHQRNHLLFQNIINELNPN